ncbi:MAG: 5-oxoprolinase subunit PxpA [Pseudomonadota bacterium]
MQEMDLNCDMGESFGRYKLGMDEEAIKHISSANIACGRHAGDPAVMDRTVRLAVSNGVGIGAHPGFPDLQGFGRRPMDCSFDEIRTDVVYQIGALKAFCDANGGRLRHVKPHGALYNMAGDDPIAAGAIVDAVFGVDPELILVVLAGPKGRSIRERALERGLKIACEAFADRAYNPDGSLVSRRLPGAVLTDPEEVAERAVVMAKDGRVRTVDGSVIEVDAQTICVHGDTAGAVEMTSRIRALLEREGISVRPMQAR